MRHLHYVCVCDFIADPEDETCLKYRARIGLLHLQVWYQSDEGVKVTEEQNMHNENDKCTSLCDGVVCKEKKFLWLNGQTKV